MRRVVVTGLGLVTPLGGDVETTWKNILAGKSGAGPITHFEATEDYDCRFACEVKGFQPDPYMDRKEAKRTDRYAQLAMAGSVQAINPRFATGLMLMTAFAAARMFCVER